MKKIVIIMMIGALLFLAACEPDEGTSREGTTPFIGGTRGLEVSYIEAFPPNRVLDRGEEPFDVIVELHNRGEADIDADDVLVTLSGFSPRLFGKDASDLQRNAPEDIEGNEMNPDGSIIDSLPVEVEFENFVFTEGVQGNQQHPFRAEVCYKYYTNAVTSLCVKNDFRRDSEDADICSVSSRRNVFNSGAPVQITNVQQQPGSSDSTRFTFTIENRDRGDVHSHGNLCETDRRTENMVRVEIRGFSESAGEVVECRGLRDDTESSGNVIIGSEGTDITCTVSFTDRTPRIQNFDIYVEYDYLERIRKDIIVETSQ